MLSILQCRPLPLYERPCRVADHPMPLLAEEHRWPSEINFSPGQCTNHPVKCAISQIAPALGPSHNEAVVLWGEGWRKWENWNRFICMGWYILLVSILFRLYGVPCWSLSSIGPGPTIIDWTLNVVKGWEKLGHRFFHPLRPIFCIGESQRVQKQEKAKTSSTAAGECHDDHTFKSSLSS